MPKPQKTKTSLAELLAKHPEPPRNDWSKGRLGSVVNTKADDDGFPEYDPKAFESDKEEEAAEGRVAGGAFAILAGMSGGGPDDDGDWIPVSTKQKKKPSAPMLAAPSAVSRRPAVAPATAVRPAVAVPPIPFPRTVGTQTAVPGLSAGPGRAPYSITQSTVATSRTPKLQTHDSEGRPISDNYYQTFQRIYRDAHGSVCMRFHKTDVVTVQSNGDVVVTSGGYRTRTTYLSIQEALQPLGMSLHNSLGGEGRGEWSVCLPDGSYIPWEDGMVLPASCEEDRGRGQRLLAAYSTGTSPATPSGVAVIRSPSPAAVPRPSTFNPAQAPAATTSASTWSYRSTAGLAAAPAPAPVNAPHLRPPAAITATPSFMPTPRTAESLSELQQVLDTALAIKDDAAGRTRSGGSSGGAGASIPCYGNGNGGNGNGTAELDDEHACIACMASLKTTLLIPCGHLVMCEPCAEQVLERSGACPMCREQVVSHVTVRA